MSLIVYNKVALNKALKTISVGDYVYSTEACEQKRFLTRHYAPNLFHEHIRMSTLSNRQDVFVKLKWISVAAPVVA